MSTYRLLIASAIAALGAEVAGAQSDVQACLSAVERIFVTKTRYDYSLVTDKKLMESFCSVRDSVLSNQDAHGLDAFSADIVLMYRDNEQSYKKTYDQFCYNQKLEYSYNLRVQIAQDTASTDALRALDVCRQFHGSAAGLQMQATNPSSEGFGVLLYFKGAFGVYEAPIRDISVTNATCDPDPKGKIASAQSISMYCKRVAPGKSIVVVEGGFRIGDAILEVSMPPPQYQRVCRTYQSPYKFGPVPGDGVWVWGSDFPVPEGWEIEGDFECGLLPACPGMALHSKRLKFSNVMECGVSRANDCGGANVYALARICQMQLVGPAQSAPLKVGGTFCAASQLWPPASCRREIPAKLDK